MSAIRQIKLACRTPLGKDNEGHIGVADEGVEFGVVKEEGGRSGMLLGTLRSLVVSLMVDGGLIGEDKRELSLADDDILPVLCPSTRGLAVLCPPSPSLCLVAAPPLCLRIFSLDSLCPAIKRCCGHWLVSSSAASRDI